MSQSGNRIADLRASSQFARSAKSRWGGHQWTDAPYGVPNMSNTNNGSRQPKSKSDYAALLDDAQLRYDGLMARRARAETELNRLLGNHQNAEQIRQLILRPNDGFAATVGKLAVVDANVKRYQRLLDVNNATPTTVEQPAPVSTSA